VRFTSWDQKRQLARALAEVMPARSPGRPGDTPDHDEPGQCVTRQVLTALAATAAGAPAASGSEADGVTQPHRIDVHHHHTPPPYVAAITARNIPGPVRDWTPAKSIEDMDKAGVATSVTSITTPAMRFLDDPGARKLARECNDYTQAGRDSRALACSP
jgi:hypothetical protein